MSLERHVKTQIVYIEYFNFCNQQLQEYIFTLRLFDNFKSIPPVSNFFLWFFIIHRIYRGEDEERDDHDSFLSNRYLLLLHASRV